MHPTVRLRRSLSSLAVAGLVVTALAGAAVTAAPAYALTPPTAVTTAATAVTYSSATLNGSVNPNGFATTYSFQYGTTTAYGSSTTSFAVGAGFAAIAVTTPLSGLLPSTTYYFQLVATSSQGTVYGGAVSLFTSSSTTVASSRLYGNDRYQTSAQVAETKYPSGVPGGVVVLATGADFPDALAGNYLAGQLRAPILLTPPTTSDPAFPTVTTALTALAATHVYLLGGTSAVGADVAAALASSYTVTRIAGPTRYDTMQLIDTQSGLTPSAGVTGGRTAIVATGANFPDALAAGPLSWADRLPLILTDGSQTSLSVQALSVISSLAITHFIVLGGNSSFNAALIAQLGTLGTIDAQFAGADRTDTASQFATYIENYYAFGKSSIIVATGTNFPDALSAGPFGGDPKPLFFTATSDDPGPYLTTTLGNLGGATSTVYIIGGFSAVDQNAATAVQTALTGGSTNSLAPVTATTPAINVSSTSATLTGTVNPNGSATTYSFQYGPSTSFGLVTTGQTVYATAGLQSVVAAVIGLTPGATYYFRLTANNVYGTTYGSVLSFVASGSLAPLVTTTAATGVTATTATLNASVNPNGVATTVYFEWGTTTAYGTTTGSLNLGSGTAAVPVVLAISGLTNGVTYYFQAVANNAYGTNLGGQLSFTTAAPTVTSVAPASGTTAGGTSVTITGTNLTGATAVLFGATAAGFTVNSATQITATAPAGSAGQVDVSVTTPGGTSALNAGDQYTYLAPPTITSAVVTPGMNSGGAAGTILVTFSAAVTCPAAAAAAYTYTDQSSVVVGLNSCAVSGGGGAPSTTWVLAPTAGVTLAAGTNGHLAYLSPGSPTTSTGTYAAGPLFEASATVGTS